MTPTTLSSEFKQSLLEAFQRRHPDLDVDLLSIVEGVEEASLAVAAPTVTGDDGLVSLFREMPTPGAYADTGDPLAFRALFMRWRDAFQKGLPEVSHLLQKEAPLFSRPSPTIRLTYEHVKATNEIVKGFLEHIIDAAPLADKTAWADLVVQQAGLSKLAGDQVQTSRLLLKAALVSSTPDQWLPLLRKAPLNIKGDVLAEPEAHVFKTEAPLSLMKFVSEHGGEVRLKRLRDLADQPRGADLVVRLFLETGDATLLDVLPKQRFEQLFTEVYIQKVFAGKQLSAVDLEKSVEARQKALIAFERENQGLSLPSDFGSVVKLMEHLLIYGSEQEVQITLKALESNDKKQALVSHALEASLIFWTNMPREYKIRGSGFDVLERQSVFLESGGRISEFSHQAWECVGQLNDLNFMERIVRVHNLPPKSIEWAGLLAGAFKELLAPHSNASEALERLVKWGADPQDFVAGQKGADLLAHNIGRENLKRVDQLLKWGVRPAPGAFERILKDERSRPDVQRALIEIFFANDLGVEEVDPLAKTQAQTRCLMACKKIDMFELLLKNGFDPNGRDEHGVSAMEMWVKGGRLFIPVLKAAVAQGAQLNEQAPGTKATLLHLAAGIQDVFPARKGDSIARFIEDDRTLVEWLLDHGADPNMADAKGRLPLDIRVSQGKGFGRAAKEHWLQKNEDRDYQILAAQPRLKVVSGPAP